METVCIAMYQRRCPLTTMSRKCPSLPWNQGAPPGPGIPHQVQCCCGSKSNIIRIHKKQQTTKEREYCLPSLDVDLARVLANGASGSQRGRLQGEESLDWGALFRVSLVLASSRPTSFPLQDSPWLGGLSTSQSSMSRVACLNVRFSYVVPAPYGSRIGTFPMGFATHGHHCHIPLKDYYNITEKLIKHSPRLPLVGATMDKSQGKYYQNAATIPYREFLIPCLALNHLECTLARDAQEWQDLSSQMEKITKENMQGGRKTTTRKAKGKGQGLQINMKRVRPCIQPYLKTSLSPSMRHIT